MVSQPNLLETLVGHMRMDSVPTQPPKGSSKEWRTRTLKDNSAQQRLTFVTFSLKGLQLIVLGDEVETLFRTPTSILLYHHMKLLYNKFHTICT